MHNCASHLNIKSIVKFFLCLVLLCLIAACDSTGLNEENTAFQKAEEYREEGFYDKAIKYYNTCLRQSPESFMAHYRLAMIFSDIKEDYPRAIVHFRDYLVAENAPKKDQVENLLHLTEMKYQKELNTLYAVARDPEPLVTKKPDVKIETLEVPETTPEKTVVKDKPKVEKTTVTQIEKTSNEQNADKNSEPGDELKDSDQASAEESIYIVEAGDNLSKISHKVYGSKKHYRLIYERNRNQMASPNQVKVGQKLIIPILNN